MSILSSLRSSSDGLLSTLLFLLLSAPAVRADRAPPIAFGHKCRFFGDCAQSDAIGIHLGTASAMRFTGDRRFAGLSGWVDGSLTFLNLVTLGGHFARDEAGATHTASAPAILFAKLNVSLTIGSRLQDDPI